MREFSQRSVPSFKPDEVEISVKDNILILSGQTKSEEKTEGENVFYSERSSNRFCRQLTLPGEVETENVEAHIIVEGFFITQLFTNR